MCRLALAAAAACFLAFPALADDAAINRIYQDMSAAYGVLDVPAMERVYTADSSYVHPAGPDFAWQLGREEIVGGFRQFFEGAKARGDSLDIDFRIVSRTRQGESVAVDVGLFKLTVTPRKGEPQVMSGTFLTVPVRQPDGSWAFAADSYGPTKVEVYDRLTPVAGLQFD